jgi:hypothetical protein
MTSLLSILRNIGVAVVVLGAWACSSPTTTNSTPTDLSSSGKTVLAGYCDHRDTCAIVQSITVSACPASMCLAAFAEEPALLEFFDCQLRKDCSAFFKDEDCIASAGTSDGERDAFIARCLAKSGECGGDDFGDACGFGAPIVRKEWMRMVDACLARPCADVRACVEAIPLVDCWG